MDKNKQKSNQFSLSFSLGLYFTGVKWEAGWFRISNKIYLLFKLMNIETDQDSLFRHRFKAIDSMSNKCQVLIITLSCTRQLLSAF